MFMDSQTCAAINRFPPFGTTLARRWAKIGDVDERKWIEGEEEIAGPRWRRYALALVAAIVALSMASVQLWNLVDRGAPPVADSGLEICGFDYCVVQDAIRAEGLGLEMSRLATTFLDEAAAKALADELVSWLGQQPVGIEVVDRLEGRTAGQYSPGTRTILLERPIRKWIVIHEVAHTVAGGHDALFVETLARLVRRIEAP